MGLDADLVAYYDAEARGGHRVALGALRARLRRGFADLLGRERRRCLVDVGAGPGLDLAEYRNDGFDAIGVDLVQANVELIRRRGLPGVTASLYRLPFPTGAFDALWTMSTFVHVPHARFDTAIGEMLRVVRPGSPLGIGTWGGQDFEGVPERGELRPYRFFSLASHQRWRTMLARHAQVEEFHTYHPDAGHDWDYQFTVLRAPS